MIYAGHDMGVFHCDRLAVVIASARRGAHYEASVPWLSYEFHAPPIPERGPWSDTLPPRSGTEDHA